MLPNHMTFERLEDQRDKAPIFTIRDAARIIFKYFRLILGCFLVVTAIIVAVLLYLPPLYKTDARVLVDTSQKEIPSFFSGIATVREPVFPEPVEREMANELELVAARSTLGTVVDELDLKYEDISLKPYLYISNLLIDLYDEVMADWTGKTPDPNRRGRDKVVEMLRKSISVEAVAGKGSEVNSSIVSITLSSPEAELGVEVLNKILDVYTSREVRQNEEAGERAYAIVQDRLEKARSQVEAAEEALHAFLANTGVTRRSAMRSSYTGASMQVRVGTDSARRGTATNEDAARAGAGTTITTPRDESIVNVLKAQLVEMEIDLVESRERFPEGSPQINSLLKSMEALREKLGYEIERSASNEATLIKLERDLETAEKVFIELEQRLAEISVYLDIVRYQISSRIVIDAPVVPSDSEWKKRLAIGALGSFASLLLGLVIAGFREYTDSTVRSEDEVRRRFGLDAPAGIPVFPARAKVGPAITGRTPLDGFLRPLCARLLVGTNRASMVESGDSVVIYVGGFHRQCGKTTVATALARQLASIVPGNALLVDANFDAPMKYEDLPAGPLPGLSEYLEGRAGEEIPAYAVPGEPGLFVMPAGDSRRQGLLFQHGRVAGALDTLRKHFDAVVIDNGDLSGSGSNAMLSLVDQVMLVFETEVTRTAVARSLLESSGVQPSDRATWGIVNKKRKYIPGFLYRLL